MKAKYLILILLFYTLFTTCKKTNSGAPRQNSSDTTNANLAVDQGTIGTVIDVRSIVKKGYKASSAEIDFSGNYAGFSKKVPIDQNTSTAFLRINADSLTNDQLTGFTNGVDATIKVYDDQSSELAEKQVSGLIVDASNNPEVVETDLPSKHPPLSLNSNIPFIIQSQTSMQVFTLQNYNNGAGNDYLAPANFQSSNNDNQKFYLKNVTGEGDSTYYIVSDRGYALSYDLYNELGESTTTYTAGGLADSYKFIITESDSGWVKIRQKNGNYLKEVTIDFGLVRFMPGANNSDFTRFRLLNGDITWTITDMGTDYSQPLLPAAQLEFAYKATLRNCSSATLTETIGRSEDKTQTFTSGTEESLELFTSQEASVQVSAGVDVDATFFGSGATYNFEATAGYTYTTSTTQTSKNYWESTQSNDVQISRERQIQLGPYTAVEAYDALETINNVKLPFTKKFRLTGTDSQGHPISGDQINFQLFANQFGGLVTAVGDSYVDFTIRGITTIDKIMEVDTKVTELQNACK